MLVQPQSAAPILNQKPTLNWKPTLGGKPALIGKLTLNGKPTLIGKPTRDPRKANRVAMPLEARCREATV